jgi:hypothetical protein
MMPCGAGVAARNESKEAIDWEDFNAALDREVREDSPAHLPQRTSESEMMALLTDLPF